MATFRKLAIGALHLAGATNLAKATRINRYEHARSSEYRHRSQRANSPAPCATRRVIYTTNMIESMNARFRQAVRRRGHFPNDQAALKVLYLVIRDRRKNRPNVVGKTAGWKRALQQFPVYFGDRVTDQTEQ